MTNIKSTVNQICLN